MFARNLLCVLAQAATMQQLCSHCVATVQPLCSTQGQGYEGIA